MLRGCIVCILIYYTICIYVFEFECIYLYFHKSVIDKIQIEYPPRPPNIYIYIISMYSKNIIYCYFLQIGSGEFIVLLTDFSGIFEIQSSYKKIW